MKTITRRKFLNRSMTAGLALGIFEAALGTGLLGHLPGIASYRELIPLLAAIVVLALRPLRLQEAVE